jgi:DNA repair protein RadA/Sms
MKCNLCDAPIKAGEGRCPSCGNWQTIDAGEVRHNRLVKLTEYSERPIERIHTGIIDETLGGGLARSAAYILTGWPGAGKSTLVLQLMAVVTKATYLCIEEGPHKIVARGKRLGTRIEHIDAIVDVEAATLEPKLEGIIADNDLVILDSLTGLYGDDLKGASNFTQNIVKMTDKSRCCVILVVHVNKGGDPAGLEAVQHWTDCNLQFQVDESSDLRTIKPLKNRHGPADITTVLHMSEKGLAQVRVIQPAYLEEMNAAAEQRDITKQAIEASRKRRARRNGL